MHSSLKLLSLVVLVVVLVASSLLGQPRMKAADLTPGAPAPAASLTLSMTGSCPGQMTFSGSGATPGGMVCCLMAAGPGNATIPAGIQCAGTALGLDSTYVLTGITFANAQGDFTTTSFVPGVWCGYYGQVIDFNSCCTSNVIQL